jgi:glycosyltransferase involved in cell wall biosynthesis
MSPLNSSPIPASPFPKGWPAPSPDSCSPDFSDSAALQEPQRGGLAWGAPPMDSWRERLGIQASLRRAALGEFLGFDARVLQRLVTAPALLAGFVLLGLPDKRLGASILTRLHRSGYSDLAAGLVERWLRSAVRHTPRCRPTTLEACYNTCCRLAIGARAVGAADPHRLLGTHVLVLKTPRPRERGVLVIHYSYVFPLLAAHFDLEAIAARYHIVLEPSWSGYCTPEILLFTRLPFPVFVESAEPRDTTFLTCLDSNLIPVPIGGNSWVDHRLFAPRSRLTRDIDIVMVAAWARFKRHWRFFEQLARLRARGRSCRVALVGYPSDLTQTEIADQARYFGVRDQIEFYQRIKPEQVARLLSRSRMHVLWSRREGLNRATIEAMFADAPVILRTGFNYGYQYPHVNDATGRFVNESDLPAAVLEILADDKHFSPRDWAMEHLTCQRATRTLEGAIRRKALEMGEQWTTGLVVKSVTLNTQQYWDPQDQHRFDADYAFLHSKIRPACHV